MSQRGSELAPRSPQCSPEGQRRQLAEDQKVEHAVARQHREGGQEGAGDAGICDHRVEAQAAADHLHKIARRQRQAALPARQGGSRRGWHNGSMCNL